jgi:hypothetical protein
VGFERARQAGAEVVYHDTDRQEPRGRCALNQGGRCGDQVLAVLLRKAIC